MHNSEEGLTNEEGRTRSLSESTLSEGDMVLPMEPVLQIARAHKEPAAPSSENFHDSIISCDSWGDLGYDKNKSLPQLPGGQSLEMTSNLEKGTAPIKQKIRGRRKGRTGCSKRNKTFPHGEQVKSSGHLSDGDLSLSSRSRGTALSDDRVDYFAALAPPDEISRSRSETKESISIMTKNRSQSLERCMPSKAMSLAARKHKPDNYGDPIECSTSHSEYDSTLAPSITARPDARQRHRLSLYKEHLIESLAWFSFHTPKCVLEDLSSNEFKHCSTEIEMSPSRSRRSPRPMDSDDDSLSSLSEDDARSIDSRSSKRLNPGSHGAG
ncbi:hypothetical protein MHU86_18752 [Fragilaria crotonensis]|nr:hypothetical protein MHU86_18752 [Fragilaria crotonensis]